MIDFRAINKITVFDAETIPNAEDIFVQLYGCKYISKFDISKGYKQLPLEHSSIFHGFSDSIGFVSLYGDVFWTSQCLG